MSRDIKKFQSPIESMHSINLTTLDAGLIKSMFKEEAKSIEICAWLRVKHAALLPAMLVVEFKNRHSINRTDWQIIDTARISEKSTTLLLNGVLPVLPKYITELTIHFCHPSEKVQCEVEELRINKRLIRQDVNDFTYVA